MNTYKALPFLAALALGTGCIGDDVGGDGDSGDTGNATMTTASTMTMTTAGDTTTTGMTMGGTLDDTGTGDDDDDDDDDDESSSGGGDPTIFMFDDTPPEDYTQLDRKGFPAINTGLNLDLGMNGDKDTYNAATPVDDAALTFAPQIIEALNTLHRGAPGMQATGTGLDDDLTGAGLTPCTPPQDPADDCIIQAGPFGIPDTVNVTVGGDAGFPNGRRPPEAVMDIILAVLLLDLDVHPLDQFQDLDGMGATLNPTANDLELPTEWPYLAAPHEP